MPSSGGYGDPIKRGPEKVLSDVLDGFTNLEAAERDYGVAVDAARTAALRAGHAVTAGR
ncbi:hypothetical protein RBS60_13530 [Sinomonas sp. ASV486]|uniref:hypothetical protein n=1 Tax=Sinomonas sp. ASV486 TaxID=3051170 RepID=UPI0027DBDBA8|nr:hypothetical protein [Sinomonas sp. ASV486]MDQ4491219.1 hypothetical protein [Sinomonas sp. ASV486]